MTTSYGGIRALRKIQLGRQADSDSDDVIAATTIWRGNGTLEDTRDLYFVKEDVGLATGSDRTNTAFLGGKITLDPIEATAEQLIHLAEMNIQHSTPTFDSGDAYVWTYPFPTTSFNAISQYCVEGGDNQQAEVMNNAVGGGFTLSGVGSKAWMMGGDLFGKQVQNQSFTGALSLPTVYTLNFSKSLLYIDADSDTFGNTLVSRTLLGLTFKYDPKLALKPTADGALTWSFPQPTEPVITAHVVFEHNTNAVNEKTQWRNENARLLRILSQGRAFTNPGNTYSTREFFIDMPGKWSKFAKIGEQNGNDVLEGDFTVKYNSTQNSSGQLVIVNALSTLP